LTAAAPAFTIHAMFILTRYVVWEVLKVFLAALVGLTLIVTLGMGFKEGLSRGLPPLVMLKTMPSMLPEMLGITLPVAMLYSVSSVFGRMTGMNEVVALKSLGVNPMVLVWPVLVLASFLSLGTVWMYEVAATWCRPNRERIICDSLEEIIYGVLQKNTSLEDPRLPVAITVKRLDGRRLIKPIIVLRDQSHGSQTTITAEEAELHTDRSDPAAPMLVITYKNFVVERADKTGTVTFSDPGTATYNQPIPVPAPNRYHRDWVAMKDISGLIGELQAEVDRLQEELPAAKRYAKASQILGMLDPNANVDRKIDEIARKQRNIFCLRTEPFRRWSNGFTCLCFALIGMPVAMLWRHADGLTNFFVCFLPILAMYYPLLLLGQHLTTSGTLPPIFFWMGNVVLTAPAIALLRWINRH
jgi:lipopolysaccharide export system permease protein